MGVRTGWCTTDRDILDDNLEHLRFIFTIDGVSYLNDLGTIYYELPYDDDPSLMYPCFNIGGYLSGWKIGESHLVTIGFFIQDALNDGWDDYEARTEMLQIYRIEPAELPTETPTPTATNTPIPLPTWTPAPIATSTPACGEMGTIDINNETGGVVTLYLTGPAKYTFSLGTGNTALSVCGGSYSYTAYGCGGASDSGTLGTGDSQKFYCQ